MALTIAAMHSEGARVMSPIEIIICGLLVLVGLVLVLNGLRHRRQERASTAWPSVPGRLLSCEIKKQVVTTGEKNRRHSYTTYHPVVRYEYEVDGARHEGNRVAFVNVTRSSEAEAQQVVDQAGPGGALHVFYNPRKPKDAVLLNTDRSGSAGYTVAGGVVVAAALITGLIFLIR
jgi:hypothetical protein